MPGKAEDRDLGCEISATESHQQNHAKVGPLSFRKCRSHVAGGIWFQVEVAGALYLDLVRTFADRHIGLILTTEFTRTRKLDLACLDSGGFGSTRHSSHEHSRTRSRKLEMIDVEAVLKLHE